MRDVEKFYIDGSWVEAGDRPSLEVINPATEDVAGTIALGTVDDVDRAVKAARQAYGAFSESSREDRVALLEEVIAAYKVRYDEITDAITEEMGAPLAFARKAQAAMGIAHFKAARKILQSYEFEEDLGTTRLLKEPVGVCGFITPWNWPINQIVCKVAPALAAGCTMVLKPSEMAPFSAALLAEVLHDAGVPKGVFNLVNGDGPTVGAAISSHPEVDMVSFTGSTRAGIAVAQAAAPTIKRVALELGGKSANIILDDADLVRSVVSGVRQCMGNSGQSCNAPTRMLVPAAKHEHAISAAREAAEKIRVGNPRLEETTMGPVVSAAQWEQVQSFIQKGIDEGAAVVAGGPGRPAGLTSGYYVRPTVFAGVTPDMTIAREEIFGPVLAIMPYGSEDEAVQIANNSRYGLSGYVQSGDLERARKVARLLRTGMVHINGAPPDPMAPFGGYKQSGNGREWGVHGFEEFLELKAVMGYSPSTA